MKRMICCLFLLFLILCQFVPNLSMYASQNQSHLPNYSANSPLFIFNEVEPRLRHETTVPPRLPAFLPSVDKDHPIYAVLKSANRSEYDILLATELPCEGQNNCLYGSLMGGVAPRQLDGGPGIPVILLGGIRGRFIKSVCHAFCTEAYVQWREKGFYYSIGIKAGKKNLVIKAANSAIGSMTRTKA